MELYKMLEEQIKRQKAIELLMKQKQDLVQQLNEVKRDLRKLVKR